VCLKCIVKISGFYIRATPEKTAKDIRKSAQGIRQSRELKETFTPFIEEALTSIK